MTAQADGHGPRTGEPALPAAARHELVPRTVRLGFLGTLVAACVVLAPWIVLLAIELPRRYVAGHWDVVWVGLDAALLVGLAVTAWAGWRRRQIVIVSALVTATLLVCDTWFDVLTAHAGRDQVLSVASAVLIQLPLAAVLFLAARRVLRLSIAAPPPPPGPDGRLAPLLSLRVPAPETDASPGGPGRADRSPTETGSNGRRSPGPPADARGPRTPGRRTPRAG
jgi:hypothetical protein